MPLFKQKRAIRLAIVLSILATLLMTAGLFVENVFFARALFFVGFAAYLAEIPLAFFTSTPERAHPTR